MLSDYRAFVYHSLSHALVNVTITIVLKQNDDTTLLLFVPCRLHQLIAHSLVPICEQLPLKQTPETGEEAFP